MAAAALVDDVVEEILLRCPPDDPARLVRAAVVCKGWRRLVSDPRFGRRFRELHRTPPLLGFLYCRRAPVLFESTTSFRPRLPPPHVFPFSWRAIDARHGRVLLSPFSVAAPKKERLIVWCPVTGDLRTLPMPQFEYGHWTAALLCAAAPGCGHLDCGCGPFLVVFVGTNDSQQCTSVCAYSSEASAWTELTSVQHIRTCIDKGPSALVGNALYFLFERPRQILKHNLVTREVSVIKLPAAVAFSCYMVLTTAEEGVLGLATTTGSRLLLWSREAGSDGDAGWVQIRVIELKGLLPPEALLTSPQAVGFADGVGVVIIRTSGGFCFTVDMKSSCVKKIGNGLSHYYVVPYMDLCTPVLRTASSGVGPGAGALSASQTEGAHVLTSRPRGNWTAY